MKNLRVLAIVLLSCIPAFANSVGLNVSSGLVLLNPGVDQVLQVTRFNSTLSYIEFDVGALGPFTMTMSWTLSVANQPPQVLNFQGTCSDTFCGWISSFYIPTSYKPVPFTLVVDFNSNVGHVSETFNEHYVSNVPEPSGLALLGTGLAAIAWRKYGYLKEQTSK